MAMRKWLNAGTTAVGPFGRGRLGWRLLAWFLVFSLVPLLVTNAIGYYRSHEIIGQIVDRYLRTVTRTQADAIAAQVQRHVFALQAITAGNEFLAAGAVQFDGGSGGEMGEVATPKAITEFLNQKVEEIGSFGALYLFTPRGAVVARAGEAWDVDSTPPQDLLNPGLAVARREDGHGSEPHLRIVAPVFGHGRRVVALLAGTVNLQRFGRFLQVPSKLGGHIESYIVDDRGRPLFVSRARGPVNYDAPVASPLVRTADARQEYRSAAGDSVVGVITPITGTTWRYLAEVPIADALGELQQLRGLSLLLEIAFVTLLVIAAWVVAGGIVAPVRRLLDATVRVTGGDLSVRVGLRQHDELGELGAAFDEMTAALASATERVRELHQQEIERASQLATVGELASGVAHEIRNPVVGVSNGLDLVRRRLGAEPALKPIIDEMARQLARIQTTLQELLAFARPIAPTFGPVSANGLVVRAVRLVQPMADAAGLHVAVHLDHRAPRFQADEDMLYQALVNVLMNAVQASREGDHITVSSRSTGDHVEIEVEDTGKGIPAAELEQVFRPFFTTRHTGTGLGLSITRGIVERHGGVVLLDSRDGIGTTVTIRVPLRSAGAAAIEEKQLA